MSSLASAKGPSTTVRLPPAYLIRHPSDVGCSPLASSRTPAFASSSWNVAISATISSLGMAPASLSSLPLTMIMNRILVPPLPCWPRPSNLRGFADDALRVDRHLLRLLLGPEDPQGHDDGG